MYSRLETIRVKLEHLIQCDEAQSVFGAGGDFGHHYVRKAVLDETAVRCLEDSFGVRLPEELRVFLMTVHGGGAGPGYGFFVNGDNPRLARRARKFPFDTDTARDVIASRLAGGTTPWQTVEAPDTDDEDDDDWPPGSGFIPIAHQGCGLFDVLVVAGEQRGRVWWCDMSWGPWYDKTGQQMGFLDWYELWLDSSLRSF